MNKKILIFGIFFLLLISSAFAVGTAPNTADTTAYWKLEDLTDATGNGYTLINNGATSGVTGIINNGYDLDGTNDYLDTTFTDSAIVDYSISVWFKPDTTNNGEYIYGSVNGGGETDKIDLLFTTSDKILWREERGNGGDKNIFSTSALTAGTWYHIVATSIKGGAATLYINGVADGTPVTTTNANMNLGTYPLVLGARNTLGTIGSYGDGVIDETSVFNVALTTDEITYLYQGGAPGEEQQYPFSVPEPASDEIIPQVVEVAPNISVDLLSTAYADVYSTIFQPVNDTAVYAAFTLTTEALNKAMVSTCRVVFDGVDYGSEVNRTLANGEVANLYLFTDEFNATAGVNTTVTVQCKSPTTGAHQLITDVTGLINIMTSVDGTPIVREHNQGLLTINSTSYQPLFSTVIESSNLTGDGLELIFAADGRIGYNYNNASTISLYATLDGTSSAIFERGGAAGTSGSGSGLSLMKNVTPATNITFTIYGKSTSGDGSVDISSVLKEFFMHQFESTTVNLSGVTLPKTATWTTIATGYVNNTNHATADIIIKASISAQDTTSTCTQSYRIKAGSTYSQDYEQTLGVYPRVATLQHVMPNPGSVNQSIELQTSNDCGVGNTLAATGGSLIAYVGFEIANTPQFYTVTARNYWNNVTVSSFNVTTDAGASYTTTNGSIDIYHVNSLQTFVTSATDFFNKTTIDHDTTTDVLVDLYQSNISFNAIEIITNNTATGTITIDGVNQTSNSSFYLAAGSYNATFSGPTYFDRTIEFTVDALDVKTVNITGISGSVLNISFKEFFTDTPKTGVTGYYTNEQYDVNESFNTGTQSFIELGVVQGLSFNVTVDDEDFALTTVEYYVNQSVQPETFYVYIINSVNIFLRDEITNSLLNTTTFALEFIGTAGSFNASTSNATYYADLITPDEYQLRYYSTSSSLYNLRSYTFTLTNQSFNNITLYAIENNQTLSTVSFNVFSTDLEPVEGATVILERYYIGEDGFSQVSSGLTNVDGSYVDFVQPINAFYRYKVLYDGVEKYASPSQGTQFAQDTTLNIYIDLGGDTYSDYQNIFNIPTTITYVNLTNYTGYFEFSYSNPSLYSLCFEVNKNGTLTESCPSVTTSGTVQIAVDATENIRSVFIASAKAYNNELGQYVVYNQLTKTFFPSAEFTQSYDDLFNLGLSIILTIVALVFIRLPIVSVVIQSFVLVLFALLPLPFYTISVVTIGWIISFNIIILWITKKDGVNQ